MNQLVFQAGIVGSAAHNAAGLANEFDSLTQFSGADTGSSVVDSAIGESSEWAVSAAGDFRAELEATHAGLLEALSAFESKEAELTSDASGSSSGKP